MPARDPRTEYPYKRYRPESCMGQHVQKMVEADLLRKAVSNYQAQLRAYQEHGEAKSTPTLALTPPQKERLLPYLSMLTKADWPLHHAKALLCSQDYDVKSLNLADAALQSLAGFALEAGLREPDAIHIALYHIAEELKHALKYNPDQPRVPVGSPGGGQWTSENGVNFIKKFEKFRANVYPDQAGNPTIGYGHKLVAGENFPKGVNKTTARKFLKNDLKTAEKTIKKYITSPLDQHQFDALVSLTYNNGPKVFRQETFKGSGKYKNTRLLNLLNNKDYSGAATQILQFNKYKDKTGHLIASNGLSRRRKEEYNIFIHGTYAP